MFDLKRLLQYEFFPAELPPCFSSDDLAANAQHAIHATSMLSREYSIPLIYSGYKSENPRRRPDILCLKKYSLKAVCTDRVDTTAGEIMKPDQILIVEVKRGGFEITSEEVTQVEYYVRQIRKSAVLHSTATIDAYVVGAKLGDIDPEKETTSGRIHAVTYGQLVETATGKLFRLRQRLQEHYNALGQESIVEQALKETKQIKIDI